MMRRQLVSFSAVQQTRKLQQQVAGVDLALMLLCVSAGPLCMDPLDATDQAINFCQCGYKMCLWCWNQLMETAAREALPGRCPNCRTEYDKDKITMAQLDPDALHREQQRRKETKKKANEAQHRPPKALGQVRVVQRNLVYAVGMPLSICREEMLADKQYFGAFGRIKKVSVNRSTPFSQVQKNGPSGSAYVTYYRPEDALRCIEAVDGAVWEGKPIKACFGTTKYCNAFLKGVPCNNADCLYLHDIAGGWMSSNISAAVCATSKGFYLQAVVWRHGDSSMQHGSQCQQVHQVSVGKATPQLTGCS